MGFVTNLIKNYNRNNNDESLMTSFKNGVKEGYSEELSPDASESEKLKHNATKLVGRKLINSVVDPITSLIN